MAITACVAFSGTAHADTSPLNIRGITWDNCVEFLDEMVGMHVQNGFGEIAKETSSRVITVVMTSGDELLTITCDRSRRPIIFDQRATPY